MTFHITSAVQYTALYVSGSGPGVLNGRPKIRKTNYNLNSIFSTILMLAILLAFEILSFNTCSPHLKPIQHLKFPITTLVKFLPHQTPINYLRLTSIYNLFINVPVV